MSREVSNLQLLKGCLVSSARGNRGKLNHEKNDVDRFRVAIAELTRLGIFDHTGVHAQSWATIRSAGNTYGLKDTCGWPGCGRTDLVRSHTIAQSFGLKSFGRDGHVLMPKIDKGQAAIGSTGLRNATTFPGYCQTHEQRFQVFEQRGNLQTMNEVALQLFRSAAREYWNKRKWWAYFSTLWEQYKDVLIEKPIHPVDTALTDAVLRPLEDIMVRTKEEMVLLSRIWQACWELSELGNEAETDPSSRLMGRVQIETSRRIALSGSTFLDVHGPELDQPNREPIVLAMFPTESGLDCVFASTVSVKYEADLAEKIANGGGDAFVDSWMVATEWWCADATWWDDTKLEWRAEILKGLAQI